MIVQALRPLPRALCGSLLIGVAFLSGAVPRIAGAQPRSTGGFALIGVTVVDPRTGALSPDMTVVIRGSRIASVSRAAKVPSGLRTIDARGKFLVPGFNDMHGHPLNQNAADNLTLNLANGITGVRQMSGTPELLQQRREGKLPTTDTATVLTMPGTILTRFNAGTPAQAIAEIDRQKAQGADFIKVVDMSSATFDAVAAESTRVGLPFLGHLPNGVEAVRAANAGFRSIEHLGPNANILISCSTDQAAIEAAIAARPAPKPPAGLSPEQYEKLFEQLAAAPLLGAITADPRYFDFLRHVVDTYDDVKCRAVVAAMKRAGTWQSPTLIRMRTIEFADDPRYVNDPNLRYVPAATRAQWTMLARRVGAALTPADRATIERFWALQVKLLRLFDANDTPMLAGSDQGGQWDIPGFSLHQEFDMLAGAGLPPLKILQMTTTNAARFLGREATMGSVDVGKDADLVLLDTNPVRDVAALHRIAGLVHAGKFYTRADLDALKAGVADRAASVGATGAASGLAAREPPHSDF